MSESSAVNSLGAAGDDGDDEALAQILSEFEAEIRTGSLPSIDEWAQRYPKFSTEIRELFPGILLMEHTASGLQGVRAPVELPERFGHYQVLRELGRGGMGVVYLAEDTKLERRVALKVFHQRDAKDERFLERFFREARAAGQLKHAHIVPIYESDLHEDTPFFAMQFVDGYPLDEILMELRRSPSSTSARRTSHSLQTLMDRMGKRLRRGPVRPDGSGAEIFDLDWKESTRICREVGEALMHAHAAGILHRDVKPGNILLDGQAHAWVTDFGLCRWEGEASVTEEGEIVGTLRYMSPEQLEGEPDERSDVYSLGLVLYELITRREAFDSSRRARLIKNIVSLDPVRPRRVLPSIPRDLETIVLKATAKLPQERYGSAGAFVRDLRAFEQGHRIAARPPSAWYLATLLVRRHKLVAGVLLFGLIAAGLLTGLYTQSLRQEREQRTMGEYNARLNAAEAALNAGSVERGKQQLMLAPARYRGWEWQHFQARLDQSLASLRVTERYVRRIIFTPDGLRAAVVSPFGLSILRVQDDGLSIERDLPGHFEDLFWEERNQAFLAVTGRGRLSRIRLDYQQEPEVVANVGFKPRNGQMLSPTELALGGVNGEIAYVDLQNSVAKRIAKRPVQVAGLALGKMGELWAIDARGWYSTWTNKPGLDQSGWSEDQDSGFSRVLMGQGFDTQGRMTLLIDSGTPVWWQPGVGQGPFSASDPNTRVLALSPDGKRVATAGVSRKIKLWNLETGELLTPLNGQVDLMDALGWRPDGQRLMSGDQRGNISLWHSRLRGGVMDLGSQFLDILDVEFTRDGRKAITASRDGSVVLWSIDSLTPLRTFWGHSHEPVAAELVNQDSQVAVLAGDGSLKVWNLATGALDFKSGSDARPGKGHFSIGSDPRGEVLFLSSSTRREGAGSWIEEWSPGTWTRKEPWHIPGFQVTCVQYNPVLGCLVSGTEAGSLLKFDPVERTIDRVIPLSDSQSRIWGLQLEAGGTRVVAFDWVKGCHVVDLAKNQPPRIFSHSGVVHQAAFLNGQNRLVGGTQSGHVALWNLETGEHLMDIDSQPNWISFVATNPAGTTIISGSSHGALRVFDQVTTSERLRKLQDRESEYNFMTRFDFGREAVRQALAQMKTGTRDGVRAGIMLAGVLSKRSQDILEAPALLGAGAIFRGQFKQAKEHLESVLAWDGLDADLRAESEALLSLARFLDKDYSKGIPSLIGQNPTLFAAWQIALVRRR